MAKICFVPLVALAVTLLVQCCAAKDLREDYLLDLPNPSEFDESFHQNVTKAISSMDIKKNSKPEEIRKEIGELAEKGQPGVSKALQNLDFVPIPNNIELIDTLKSIIAQSDDDSKAKSPFVAKARALLNNYVKPKFREMDFWYKHAYGSPRINEVLDNLDGTFSNLLNVGRPESCHEDELEEWLRDLELDEAELDVPKMLKALRGDRTISSCNATLGPFQWVMNKNCDKMHSFSNLIQMLQLDGTIRDQEDLPEGRPRRLNDYYRICQDWQNLDKRTLIEKNLQKQLDESRPECSKSRSRLPAKRNDNDDNESRDSDEHSSADEWL